MNFIYVIHLLYWNQLTDLIIHSRSNRSNRNNSIHCNDKGARARSTRPFNVSVPAVVSVAFVVSAASAVYDQVSYCLLYTSPSPRDRQKSRMPSSA